MFFSGIEFNAPKWGLAYFGEESPTGDLACLAYRRRDEFQRWRYKRPTMECIWPLSCFWSWDILMLWSCHLQWRAIRWFDGHWIMRFEAHEKAPCYDQRRPQLAEAFWRPHNNWECQRENWRAEFCYGPRPSCGISFFNWIVRVSLFVRGDHCAQLWWLRFHVRERLCVIPCLLIQLEELKCIVFVALKKSALDGWLRRYLWRQQH